MTTTLIVTAHPGPTSVSHAWAAATARAARALGHRVLTSDLYAMGFDPAERAALYGLDGPFDPLKAQEAGAPADAVAEAEKIESCDVMILHFPLWWFAPPAMLKGWTDRVLIHGRLHDVDRRFDTGSCQGKTALFCVTTGADAVEIGPGGKEGNLDLLLWPLAYTLRYCGFDIARPAAIHNVHGYHKGAAKVAREADITTTLAAQHALLAGIGDRPRWRFNADTDFENGRLKPGAPSFWPFIA